MCLVHSYLRAENIEETYFHNRKNIHTIFDFVAKLALLEGLYLKLGFYCIYLREWYYNTARHGKDPKSNSQRRRGLFCKTTLCVLFSPF